jgi:hypothetical protein
MVETSVPALGKRFNNFTLHRNLPWHFVSEKNGRLI